MSKHVHGGDIYKDIYSGRKMLDFSANINPLGTPAAVFESLASCAEICSVYPDPHCRKLRAAISGFDGVAQDKIFCSNGAAEIIYRISQGLRPSIALLPAPTFAEYQESLESAGCEVRHHYLLESEGFTLTPAFADAITPEIDIAFVCNPNNPVGLTADYPVLLQILNKCKETNTLLVVDECFINFTETGTSLKSQLDFFDNLIIVRAFTKIFAMAGIRLGYCFCSNRALLEKISTAGQPWSVSCIAQACGVAALSEPGFIEKSAGVVSEQRKYLTNALIELGVKVFESHTNFILFWQPDIDLCAKLADFDILIRSCANFEGLREGFFRIAVKSEQDNKRLISALKQIL